MKELGVNTWSSRPLKNALVLVACLSLQETDKLDGQDFSAGPVQPSSGSWAVQRLTHEVKTVVGASV